MTFPINTNIPNGPNDPADDVPLMKGNFANISSYLNVDHVLAGTTGAGKHLQVTFFSKNTPGIQIDPASADFTADSSTLAATLGSASTIAQRFFRNQVAILPLSALRAFCFFQTPGTISNAFNVAGGGVVRVSAGKYTVVLVSNAVTSVNFCVNVSCTIYNTVPSPAASAVAGYVITGIGTFQLNFLNLNGVYTDPTTFSFTVFQV